ncbi:MAG: DNA-formamidopyrimidine glycosylase [Anaerolineae bacterium]
MPELPEVETIVRKLKLRIIGQRVASVQVRWPRSVAIPSLERFKIELVGREICSVGRRGKYIVITLAPNGFLLVHLRMTGRLIFVDADSQPHPLETDPHTHVVLEFVSRDRLYFRDTRKFGRLFLVDNPSQVLDALGIEPLGPDFTSESLGLLLIKRRRPLKVALLDQSMLAGLGNIYVDESLWHARLSPCRTSNTLTIDEVGRLHQAISSVLACALEHHGTTLRDYRDPDNEAGANVSCLEVYGRAGQSCSRCGMPIERMVVAQRGTHYCPRCQGV